MNNETFDKISTITAYHRLRLSELEKYSTEISLNLEKLELLFSEIDSDIDSLKQETENLDEYIKEKFGIDILDFEDNTSLPLNTKPKKDFNDEKKYKLTSEPASYTIDQIYDKATVYLKRRGVDINKDPLLQILPKEFLEEVIEKYNKKYGDVSWTKIDYLVVGVAASIAVILDIFIVRTPENTTVNFFGKEKEVESSPLTNWIKEKSKEFHDLYGVKLEEIARVPYDGALNTKSNGRTFYDKKIDGLHPKLHRLMSLGHDPIAGIIFGVLDIIQNKATFFDKNGNLIRTFPTNEENYQISLIKAFIKFILHLLSDIGTEKGIPAPLFSLLQAIKIQSPFALRENGEKVSWTDVARYMYTHGYDFRHFISMGIVPMTVEIIIRGYWLLSNYGKNKELLELEAVKLSSMRLIAHSIVASGNLIKTGLIYKMNPLALNYTELFLLTQSFISWIKDSYKRDKKIKEILLTGWKDLYKSSRALNSLLEEF